eukprot:CCRYP_017123-RA/>CCRYP_017123-RA protein AED:0.36 eAED:0.43 QI:0/0/0/1/0/0.5/2/0/182
MICVLKPEVIHRRLGDILKSVIQQLMRIDQPAILAQLCLFIDWGYLEIAKAQNNQVTNLIQIMEEMNVKFLGTVKNNNAFPFQSVEVNMDGKQIVNGKVVAQTYGMRTNFMATTKSNRPIQASVLRHGMGPRFMGNIYETNSIGIDRLDQHKAPPMIVASAKYAWDDFFVKCLLDDSETEDH